jgi:hypothetical protein
MDKAHPRVLDHFLQMLDAGRITLATGETKSLENFYIVFTSNLGAAEAMRMERSSWASIEAAVLRRVAQEMRPELVGRIDEKVVFAKLSPDVQREICELLVATEVARLRRLGYDPTRRSRNQGRGAVMGLWRAFVPPASAGLVSARRVETRGSSQAFKSISAKLRHQLVKGTVACSAFPDTYTCVCK